jgi:hypothetical protein
VFKNHADATQSDETENISVGLTSASITWNYIRGRVMQGSVISLESTESYMNVDAFWLGHVALLEVSFIF